ncbi:phage baseplate assembly protein V [Sphingomonas arantia]|uniref:Phage baseplate assembly protein V n=1 Tax=Sphingomonas arantia TaxID=1460676 RepID=A0ABW4TTA4_9SPHN
MSDPSDTQRLIGDAIRLGTIETVDRAAATCTVRIGDLLTDEVPWLAFRAGGSCAWSPPTIGEQCLLLCPEGDTASGVVLLGLYSDANPAPSSADKLDLLRFADGAEISYDAVAHRLTAKLPAGGSATIDAPGGIELIGPVTITGKVTVSDDVVADGISLKSHVHAGVQSGGAKTLVPFK